MIPDEVKKKIDEFCEERASNIEEWEGNEMSLLIKTAEFGYSLASEEIEKKDQRIRELEEGLRAWPGISADDDKMEEWEHEIEKIMFNNPKQKE